MDRPLVPAQARWRHHVHHDVRPADDLRPRTGLDRPCPPVTPPVRGQDVRSMMLAVSWDTIRVFLHVLAATVWVGGQITLAALVPVLRMSGADIPRAAARRFNQVAWPAFAVLIVTGIWNVIAVRSQVTGGYRGPPGGEHVLWLTAGARGPGRLRRARRRRRARRPVPGRSARWLTTRVVDPRVGVQRR